MLLHGLGGSNRYWGGAYDRIALSRQLIVPDLLGFGSSPKPTSGYSAAAHVQALIETLDWLGVDQPVILGSHSAGSVLALALAAAHPERVAAIVAAGPPLYPDRTAARRHIGKLSWLSHQLAEGRSGARRVCEFTCAHRRLAGTLALLGRRRLPREVVFDGVRHTWASYSETFTSFILDVPPGSWMQGVRVPVRLVAGSNDRVVDASHLSMIADQHEHVTFTQVRSTDHDLPIANPERMLIEMSALEEWARSE